MASPLIRGPEADSASPQVVLAAAGPAEYLLPATCRGIGAGIRIPANAHASVREVMIMEDSRQVSRQSVVDRLRKAGFKPAAEAAGRELPDPVTYEQAAKLLERLGIFLDDLTSRMGGSP